MDQQASAGQAQTNAPRSVRLPKPRSHIDTILKDSPETIKMKMDGAIEHFSMEIVGFRLN